MNSLITVAIASSIIFTLPLTTFKIANGDLAHPTDNANLGPNWTNVDLKMCVLATNSCGQGSDSTCDINATCPDSPKKPNTSS